MLARIAVRTREVTCAAAGSSMILIVLFSRPVVAQDHGAATIADRAYSTTPIGADRAAAWRMDLDRLIPGMERIHPDLYHQISRDALTAAVSELSGRLPSMAEHEVIVELARIVALVGDGHTSLPLYFAAGVNFHILPVRFGFYGGQLYVEAADRAYADLVGGRVVAFGGQPVDSAVALATPLISRDNDQWLLAVMPHLLNRAEVLHALRLSDRLDRASLTVEKAGRTLTRTVAVNRDAAPNGFGLPFLPRYSQDWVDARDGAGSPPLYQQRFDETYWFEMLRDRRMMYIAFNQVQNRHGAESALEFFRRAMLAARENAAGIDRVVLDIRNNTGGEGGLLDPIIREIVRTHDVDEPGRFFVITGRRTFSAAQQLATQLDRYTSAIFAGEPTSGRPNSYGSHEPVALPAIGVQVSVSVFYHQNGQPYDDRAWIAPRVAADITFDDYANNRDPVLDAIASWPGDDAWRTAVRDDVTRMDTVSAARRVAAFDADPINRWTSSTGELNRLGYEFLNAGRVAEALVMFRMNVRLHPGYANGWDSLGEAYVKANETDRAIAAYTEAVRLDPHNANARAWLERLRGR